MSYFGKLEFKNDTKKLKFDVLSIQNGKKMQISKDIKCITNRDWGKIETALIKQNILHIAKPKNISDIPFESVEVYDGTKVKALLGAQMLKYIYKYNLGYKNALYSKVGIVDGNINTTLDLLYPLSSEVTDLTIFTPSISVYEQVLKEIYLEHKIRIKIMPINQAYVSQMDIIFDLTGKNRCIKYAKPNSVYVFIKSPIENIENNNKCLVWGDFDVLFNKYESNVEEVEAYLMAEGYTKAALRKIIGRFDIKIHNVYAPTPIVSEDYFRVTVDK
ncbi:MAG: hypothetical protein BEN19_05850 [Epulopiscium sp. Nuni2H_MBin003]|nr:MAG: hypothetical protein BEN19_05850 [Epulopiscium sp. Nuni2H_MBin003]